MHRFLRNIVSGLLYCGLIGADAMADKGPVRLPNQITPASLLGAATGPETGVSVSFDVSGWEFYDQEGAAINNVFMLDIGTPLGLGGMDLEVNGIGWDFLLTTVGFSWGSEATIGFDWTSDLVNDVYLTPSLTDASVTMEPLSSGGHPIKLGSLSIPNGMVPGGVLRVELFETFVDNPGAVDAFLNSGMLTIQIEPVTTVSGDFNGDDIYDCLDIDALVSEIVAGTNNPAFDLTGDNLVNLQDRDAWLAEAGEVNLPSGNPYFPADFNLDGDVDGLDFLLWNEFKFTSTGAFCMGDATADGVTDGLDFLTWNEFKFMSSDAASAVPEPAAGVSLLLLVLACRARHWS